MASTLMACAPSAVVVRRRHVVRGSSRRRAACRGSSASTADRAHVAVPVAEGLGRHGESAPRGAAGRRCRGARNGLATSEGWLRDGAVEGVACLREVVRHLAGDGRRLSELCRGALGNVRAPLGPEGGAVEERGEVRKLIEGGFKDALPFIPSSAS